MANRPRLFSFFSRAADATALIPPPFSVAAGLQSEPPLTVTSKQITDPASEILSLTAQLASVTAERDQGAAAYTSLAAKFTEAEAKYASLESSLAPLNATIASLTAERDTLKSENARTRADLTQEIRNTELATLAASQGVPAGAEIVPANGPGGKSKNEELEEVLTEMKTATDPGVKGALASKARGIREAIRSGK